MESPNKQHWENIYQTKQANEMSWTQEIPETSIHLITALNLPKSASIIDVGGGDSNLVDYLLAAGYEDISVLDISESALERAKARLGVQAQKVTWLVGDVTSFKSEKKYTLWHDRAAFHFMTTEQQIKDYIYAAQQAAHEYLIVGTFSENGPQKCSGLTIKQYSEDTLQDTLAKNFSKLTCITQNHITPFNTVQNFLFCSFKKLAA